MCVQKVLKLTFPVPFWSNLIPPGIHHEEFNPEILKMISFPKMREIYLQSANTARISYSSFNWFTKILVAEALSNVEAGMFIWI